MGNLTAKTSGEIASFMTPAKTNIKSLKVHFSPKQLGTGDPSPENVREIVGWNGVEVNGCGKNLINLNTIKQGYRVNIQGEVVLAATYCLTDYIPVSPSSKYYLSNAGTLAANARTAFYDKNKELLSTTPNITPITTSNNCAYIRCSFRIENIDIVQLELGSTATSYEPYQGNTISYQWKKLPDEYQEVEWISNDVENNSLVYIDTNYAPTIAPKLITTIKRVKNSDKDIFGFQYNNFPSFIVDSANTRFYNRWGNTSYTTINVTTYNTVEQCEFGKNTIINGELKATFGDIDWSTNIQTMRIFAGRDNNSNNNNFFYIYGDIKLYDGDLLVRHMIPCYKKSDDEIGLYDLITKAFFTKTGTGTFIKGDDVDVDKTFYGGYVDLISGELVEEYGCVKLEDLNWTAKDNRTRTDDLSSSILPPSYSVMVNIIGEQVQPASYSMNLTNYPNAIACSSNGQLIKYYDGENPQGLMAYQLKTPITHQLTPTQLQSFIGQNNFWSNADYVEIEYELIETEDIQKCRKKIILNQPHTESVIGDVANFSTNMKAPLKECKVYFNPIQEGSGDPSPDNVRNIVGWNGVNVGLPSEYQEVEYIESTGTQYIDTGITLDANDFAISFNFEQTKRTSGEQPITSIWTGSYNYWNLFIRSISSDKYVLDTYTSGHHTLSTEVNLNEKYTVSLIRNENSWELTQGDSTISWTYSPSTINNTTLKLFKRGDLSTGHSTNIKMYSFKMTISNTRILNLIPCYRKADGEIGMYDTVSKTFYTNAGTGTFLKGDDINKIIENVSWSDSIGTVYGGYVDLAKGELVGNWIKRDLSEMSTINAPNSSLEEPWNHRFLIENWDYDNSGWDKIGGTDNFIIDNITNDAKGRTNFTAVGIGNSPIIYIYDNTISTVEEFKTKYSGHYICYETKYPVYYSLTPQQLLTFKGENNIWSDTNGQTEVKFWTH